MLLSFGGLFFVIWCALLPGLRVTSFLLAITHQFTLTHLLMHLLLRHLTLLILPSPALPLLLELPLRFLAKLKFHSRPTAFLTFHTPPTSCRLRGQDLPLIFQALRWPINFGNFPKVEGFFHQYRKSSQVLHTS